MGGISDFGFPIPQSAIRNPRFPVHPVREAAFTHHYTSPYLRTHLLSAPIHKFADVFFL